MTYAVAFLICHFERSREVLGTAFGMNSECCQTLRLRSTPLRVTTVVLMELVSNER